MACRRLGFMQLAIICGFSMFYAYYLMSFFGFFMLNRSQMGFTELHAGQIVFFLASILTTGAFLAQFRQTNSVAIGHAHFIYLAALIPGLLLPACMSAMELGLEVGLPQFYAACTLAGASIGVGFMLWEDLSMRGYLNRGVLAHGIVFSAGGIAFLATTFFEPRLGNAVISALCLCASTALFAFIALRCSASEDSPAKPASDFFGTMLHLDIVVAVINTAFGYAFIMLYQQNELALLGAMAAAIAADLCFSIAFGRGRWIMFAGAVRICAAIASCTLILYSCLNGAGGTVALCLAIVLWFVFRTVNGGSLTDLANRLGNSSLYTCTRGKLSSNIGFTIGLGLGVVIAQLGSPAVAHTYVPLALVALFIMTALFLLPFDAESSKVGYKTLALVKMHEAADSSIQVACEAVSHRYKLSPREAEVLCILVKGRNAKHIAEKLYISESTAKTHISKIYRKTGVHSQQELLDAIEHLQAS